MSYQINEVVSQNRSNKKGPLRKIITLEWASPQVCWRNKSRTFSNSIFVIVEFEFFFVMILIDLLLFGLLLFSFFVRFLFSLAFLPKNLQLKLNSIFTTCLLWDLYNYKFVRVFCVFFCFVFTYLMRHLFRFLFNIFLLELTQGYFYFFWNLY